LLREVAREERGCVGAQCFEEVVLQRSYICREGVKMEKKKEK